jgi:hypothetical protein
MIYFEIPSKLDEIICMQITNQKLNSNQNTQ